MPVEVRAAINRSLIERFRVVVPIDATTTVYQGDLLDWNTGTNVAAGAGPSATHFVGMAETTNPVETAGSPSLLSNSTNQFVNCIQEGLVWVIAEETVTLQPFTKLRVGNTDAQHVASLGATNANCVGVVDPKWAVGGKAVVLGDKIKMWLRVRATYKLNGGADAELS